MVPSHRRALRARLLSFRYIEAINSELDSPRDDWASKGDKDMAGETPANPAVLVGLVGQVGTL